MTNKSIQTVSTSQVMSDVAQQFDSIPKKLTREVISEFLNLVETSVVSGNKVRLDKIGVLVTKESAARKGRNPQTGAEIEIPASRKVSFRPSKTLKDQVIKSNS